MAIITRTIINPGDDAYTYDGTSINTSGFISAGNAGVLRNAGMIFRNLPIPRTSTINGATITWYSAGNLSGNNCNTKFYAEATTNPNQFTTAADFEGRTMGTASVSWGTIPAWTINTQYSSPNINTVIQEVVNRGDWASGKDIAVFWKNDSSDTNARRGGWGYEDSASSASVLTIDYTPAPVMTMRVSLPGYDALTDGTVDHYALYSDEDNVLIKEYTRGTVGVTQPGTATIAHNFGYPPFFMAYAVVSGAYQWVYGSGFYNNQYAYANTANLYLVDKGTGGGTTTFKYYIFYDNQT